MRCLFCLHIRYGFQASPGFGGFKAVRISVKDRPPGGAVIVQLFSRPVESKCDALTVVAIEPAEIQKVAESGRAIGTFQPAVA
jgi:hypothetical protein